MYVHLCSKYRGKNPDSCIVAPCLQPKASKVLQAPWREAREGKRIWRKEPGKPFWARPHHFCSPSTWPHVSADRKCNLSVREEKKNKQLFFSVKGKHLSGKRLFTFSSQQTSFTATSRIKLRREAFFFWSLMCTRKVP